MLSCIIENCVKIDMCLLWGSLVKSLLSLVLKIVLKKKYICCVVFIFF